MPLESKYLHYSKKITYEQIFNIANNLVNAGHIPTIKKIKECLGSGSKTTIHKYFKQWKQMCFKKALHSSDNLSINLRENNILEEKHNLEQTLNKQIIQNKHYAQELMNLEKANIALKEKNCELQTINQELKLRLTTVEAAYKVLEQLTQEITNRLDANHNKNASNQQQIINDLRKELKTLNEISLIALRETSTQGHEALMQEKVNSINLQTKVDSLYKELIDLKKQLSDTALKHQIQTQTLLRQINKQQKIIQDHIGFEKLCELVGEQEVMLHFNNRTSIAYGK